MSEAKPRRRWGRLVVRGAAVLVLLLVVAALVSAFLVRRTVRASLPELDGTLPVAGVGSSVVIERDEAGVPTIRADSIEDATFALGFLHGQERFFQMDLQRRDGAGELSELFGALAANHDRGRRLHRFRARAVDGLARMPPSDRERLEIYTAGINAGLEALGARPPEYLMLRQEPRPWQPEDSLIVIYSMYLVLQDSRGATDTAVGAIRQAFPAPVADFLLPVGTSWDAPLTGDAAAEPPIPGPELLDLRDEPPAAAARVTPIEEPIEFVGSNNWAVAGSRTSDGRTIVADDMHLGHGMPNIWYRAVLTYPDGDSGETWRVVGVTLPGTPGIVTGSNGRIAWGFTNGYVDTTDVVLLDMIDETHYRTPDGPREIRTHPEVVRVAGGEDVEFEVRETIWGPLLEPDDQGRPRALSWVAHLPGAASLGVAALQASDSVEAALEAAPGCGIPVQNLVVVDDGGHIAWTLAGILPHRLHRGDVPVSWANGDAGWNGFVDRADHPRVVDPESGVIWTANNRVVDLDAVEIVGDGGWALGARARQIRDDLLQLSDATEEDLLAIQLDDRAVFLERWRKLLLDTLGGTDDPDLAILRDTVADDWSGRASIDSAGFALVRAWRQAVERRVIEPILSAMGEARGDFNRYDASSQWEGPTWRLLRERPPHLLGAEYDSWDALLLDASHALVDWVRGQDFEVAGYTWGEVNRVRFAHPLTNGVPALSGWLDIETESLPGAGNMPRVQHRASGASERFVVSPGREQDGLFHMPGGQSGHFLSPHYRLGHRDWAEGRPSPLLPGPTRYTLTLRHPAASY